jgi:hypothetical protein
VNKLIVMSLLTCSIIANAKQLKPGTTYGQVSTELNAIGYIDRSWDEDGKLFEVFAFDYRPCWIELHRIYVRFIDGLADQWNEIHPTTEAAFICKGDKIIYAGSKIHISVD